MLARLKRPIAFDAIDGQPVNLIVLLLLPANAQGAPLNALACAARTLRDADVLSKWPHQFSGGQRQRLMIARALLVQPELLIPDDPTSTLEASLRVPWAPQQPYTAHVIDVPKLNGRTQISVEPTDGSCPTT